MFEKIFFYILRCPVQALIQIMFMHGSLTYKCKTKLPLLLTVAMYVAILSVFLMIPESSVLAIVFSLTATVISIIPIVLLYSDKISIKMLIFFIFYILTFLLDVLVSPLRVKLSKIPILTPMEQMIIYCAVADIAYFLMFFLFWKIWRRQNNRFYSKSITSSTIIVLSQFSMLVIIQSLRLHGNLNVEGTLLYLIWALTIVSDIAIIQMLLANSKFYKTKLQVQELEYENKVHYQHYMNIRNSIDNMHKHRHDMNNILNTALNLNNDEELQQYLLSQLHTKITSAAPSEYCENHLVNAILNDKCVPNDNLTYDIDVFVPSEIAIDSFDFCSILCNLLDNAAEAVNGITDKKSVIRLEMSVKIGCLFITVSNSISCKIDISKTKKKDKYLHGQGLKIVRNIVEKYNGTIDFSDSNSTFTVKAMLTLSDKQNLKSRQQT